MNARSNDRRGRRIEARPAAGQLAVIVAKMLLVEGRILATPEIHGPASVPCSLVSMPWALQRFAGRDGKDFRRDGPPVLIQIAADPTGEKPQRRDDGVLSDENMPARRLAVDGTERASSVNPCETSGRSRALLPHGDLPPVVDSP